MKIYDKCIWYFTEPMFWSVSKDVVEYRQYRINLPFYENIKKSGDGYVMCQCSKCGEYFCPTYKSIVNRMRFHYGYIDSPCEFVCLMCS
jgi:formylmethanofuran dehydrogenase subunit E